MRAIIVRYIIPLFGIVFSSQIIASTSVCGDQFGVWGVSGSPYLVSCDVNVPAGEVLTIEPGVTVLLYDGLSINAYGQILAIGDENNHIVFDAVTSTHTWNRIYVYGSGSFPPTSRFEYCDFSNAQYALYPYIRGKIDNDWTVMQFEVSNSTFSTSINTAIYAEAVGVDASQYMTPKRRHAKIDLIVDNSIFEGIAQGIEVNPHGGCNIYCVGAASDPIITNSIFSGITGSAFKINDGVNSSGNPEFLNNSVVGVGVGVSFGEFIAIIENNVFVDNDTAVDKVASSATVAYNDFFGNAVDCVGCSPAFGDPIWMNANGDPSDLDYNLFMDPLFVSPTDYHLMPSSPLIDAGMDLGAPSADFDGDIRPQGSHVDIGMDEVVSNVGVLTVSKIGTGNGAITSNPAGINCGVDCSETYPPGTIVELTPDPDASSTFIGWTGCDSVSGDICTVTVNASRTVTATFDQAFHTLTANRIGTGTGTVSSNPGSISCGAICSDDYLQGTTVDLTPTADAGSLFAGWSGCDAVSGTVCSVLMNSSRTVTATFNANTGACGSMTIHQTDSSGCPSMRTIVSVRDDQGLPILGLTANEFGLDEDGVPRAVQLETGGALAVSLVVDKSGSLSSSDLSNIRQASVDFIGLLSPGDSVAVYQFDSVVRLLQDYTTDLSLAISAVNAILSPGGSTALYDGIYSAAEHAAGITGRKGVIVMTDGRNNASTHSITQAIGRAVLAGVPVFTIGFGNADPVVLTDIADQTGGLYYAGATSSDLQDLLNRLGAVLNSQYVLLWDTGFVDGGVHGIAVEAQAPGCTVIATSTYTQAGSPCGSSCMAVRSLPQGYAAGAAAPVEISVQPTSAVYTYAVQDVPPAGMTVSNISGGGLLDNGKVKWGPYFDNLDRDLSYKVTPPAGTQGNIGWSGVLSHDGVSEAICGDKVLPEGVVHPADLGVSGDDWSIQIEELTAYTTAWKIGDVWTQAPNPIPLSYAVNAGYLWQNGEDYYYDAFLDPPWEVGVMTTAAAHYDEEMKFVSTSGSAVSSFNPRYYVPGVSVDVTLTITPPAATQSYAIEETPPEGWPVTNISHSGTFDSLTNQIRWGLFLDDTPRTLTYAATPPVTAVDAQSFIGNAAFDSIPEPINGQRTILPSPCAGTTLHIHTLTFENGEDVVCSATDGMIMGPNVDMENGAILELQSGNGTALTPPVRVQLGGVLTIGEIPAP